MNCRTLRSQIQQRNKSAHAYYSFDCTYLLMRLCIFIVMIAAVCFNYSLSDKHVLTKECQKHVWNVNSEY